MTWFPPRSPWGLIQEDLFPSEWFILVSCVMLNCTSRKQVEKVLPAFMLQYPGPDALLEAASQEIADLIAPLGFKNRRSKRLQQLAHAYVNDDWTHASELPGIGEYGSRTWEIFIKGQLGNLPPKDGALERYWRWCLCNRTRLCGIMNYENNRQDDQAEEGQEHPSP